MKLIIINIVKGFLAVTAVLNLILLFGFGYEIPGFNKREEIAETALYGSTTIEEDSSTADSAEEYADSSADNGSTDQESIAALTEKESEEIKQKCKIISRQNARIRRGPGTDYDRITSVPPGTILTIIGEENGWYHVQLEDGTEGYVSGELVELIEQE